ncbi:uncharacterized protein LOC143301524 [Babylonia areolata]|uniref:uncharacterized protein LOC143301524 n=1 Tax=Babylonia areolata TaxID=304850 RepID=UPI003FD07C2E
MWTMVSTVVSSLALTLLCCQIVPFTEAASLFFPFTGTDHFGGMDDSTNTAVTKRGNGGVDAWSICPPHMANVDCFYAYLRVYARLRKAAEESDRVSMRNIGKRASVASLPGVSRSRRRMRAEDLCPEEMAPAQCYRAVITLQRRLQAAVLNAQ